MLLKLLIVLSLFSVYEFGTSENRYRVVITTCTAIDFLPQTGDVTGIFYDGILGLVRLQGFVTTLRKKTDQNKIKPNACWEYKTSIPVEPKAIKGLKIQWKKTWDEDGDEIKIASVEICSADEHLQKSWLCKRFEYGGPIKNGETISMKE